MDTHPSPAPESVLEQQHPRWWWGQAGEDHARIPLLLRKKKRGQVQPPVPGRGADPRFTHAGCPCTHSPERAHGKGLQGGCSNFIMLLFNTVSSTSLESHHLPASLQPHISHRSVAGVPHAAPQPAQLGARPAQHQGLPCRGGSSQLPCSPPSLLPHPLPHSCPDLLPAGCSPLCVAGSAVASAAP